MHTLEHMYPKMVQLTLETYVSLAVTQIICLYPSQPWKHMYPWRLHRLFVCIQVNLGNICIPWRLHRLFVCIQVNLGNICILGGYTDYLFVSKSTLETYVSLAVTQIICLYPSQPWKHMYPWRLHRLFVCIQVNLGNICILGGYTDYLFVSKSTLETYVSLAVTQIICLYPSQPWKHMYPWRLHRLFVCIQVNLGNICIFACLICSWFRLFHLIISLIIVRTSVLFSYQ